MEAFLIIRFFGLLIIALYVYMKILNITHISKIKIISAILFSLIMSVPLSYVPFYEIMFLGSFCVFVAITTRVKPRLLLTAVFISTGISLGIEILAFTTVLAPSFLVDTIFKPSPEHTIQISPVIVETVVIIISIILSYFFFRVKRLKKGFVFLESKEATWIGIIFSVIIMFSRSVLDETGAILFFINICTIGIYFWWQNHTTMLYHQRVNEREIERCLAEIHEKDNKIRELCESNAFLAKAVHRDNKLIPAMYNAVMVLLGDAGSNDIPQCSRILRDLDEIMQERKEVISALQGNRSPMPSTGIWRIDNIMNYMQAKASEKDIFIDFLVSDGINFPDQSQLPTEKLSTLLADLIENAIIATSHSAHKKILVEMGMVDGCYEITIQDSGIPFEVETLISLGLKKATTHADQGGSGIGYLTIFDILSESKASLILSEYPPENLPFAKSIKVRNDGKSMYSIYSYRAELIRKSTERVDMNICHQN